MSTRTFLEYVLNLCLLVTPSPSDVERIQLLELQDSGSTLSFMETWVTADRSNDSEELWEVRLTYMSCFFV